MSEAKVIVVGNEKGGAGKSTLAIHIVAALLEAGRHVAVIDLDLRQKSVARFFANRRAWLAANNQTLPEPSVADLGDGAASNASSKRAICSSSPARANAAPSPRSATDGSGRV